MRLICHDKGLMFTKKSVNCCRVCMASAEGRLGQARFPSIKSAPFSSSSPIWTLSSMKVIFQLIRKCSNLLLAYLSHINCAVCMLLWQCQLQNQGAPQSWCGTLGICLPAIQKHFQQFCVLDWVWKEKSIAPSSILIWFLYYIIIITISARTFLPVIKNFLRVIVTSPWIRAH